MSVIRNGSTIIGPVLIFHDEIRSLFCQSSVDTGVAWHLPNGTTVGNFTPFEVPYQFISFAGMSSLLYNMEYNGLWSCRLSGDTGSAIPVGLYQRGREYSIAILA